MSCFALFNGNIANNMEKLPYNINNNFALINLMVCVLPVACIWPCNKNNGSQKKTIMNISKANVWPVILYLIKHNHLGDLYLWYNPTCCIALHKKRGTPNVDMLAAWQRNTNWSEHTNTQKKVLALLLMNYWFSTSTGNE